MGKINHRHRHNVITQEKKRHEKIKKLRSKYLTADSKSREGILTKLKRISRATSPEGQSK